VKKRKIIRRTLIVVAWFIVISGITTLLVAAHRKQKEHLCKDIVISIKGNGDRFYIEKNDIIKQVEFAAHSSLLKRPVQSIDLAKIEKALERNPWINDAELYFDTKDGLHISIEEREPIARVFTNEGNSFYIDSSGHRMPLLDKISIRVPVVTGYTNARRLNTKDSALLKDVKKIAQFVYSNEFWNAQIGQINITEQKKIELIPVIGEHLISIGNGEKIEEKLGRLYVFYREIMSKTGFNKYSVLDLQYDGQVVAVKKGNISAVDSALLKKNIEELIRRNSFQDMNEDIMPGINNGSIARVDSLSNTARKDPVSMKTNPNPLGTQQTLSNEKSANQSKTSEIPGKEKKKGLNKKPKAVMKTNIQYSL
jgi:cell division protein FtsQ